MEVVSTPRPFDPLKMGLVFVREWTKEEVLADTSRRIAAGHDWSSQREMARFYGVAPQTLHDWLKGAPICRTRIGRRKVVGGN